MNSRSAALGTDPVWRLLGRLALPAVASLLVNASYNIADSVIVGRFVGTDGLAAVGLNFPLNIFLISVGILVGVGSGALISRRLGARDSAGADRAFGASLVLLLGSGTVVTVLGFVFASPILRVLGASAQVLPLARPYFLIILGGSGLVIANQALNNLVYAEGAGHIGFTALTLSSLTNIVLDLWFVGSLGWGIEGAALATVIAQAMATVFLLIWFAGRRSQLNLRLCWCRPDMLEILRVGISASVRALTVVVLGVVVNLQAGRVAGDIGVAVASVVFRVVSVVVLPAFGVNQAFLPVAAFNYGARSYSRTVQAVWQALLLALTISYVATALVIGLAEPIASVFNNDPGFVAMTARGLRRSFFLSPLIICNLVAGGFFQALGNARRSLLIGVSRMGFFIVPLLLVLPPRLGLDGIWLSFPIGEVAAAVFSLVIALPELRKLARVPDGKDVQGGVPAAG